MAFYRDGKARGGFETGIQQALARILVDPRFILRFDGASGITAGTRSSAADVALASRLSFLLWSSIPDEALLAAAAGGELSRPRDLERQVRRMLADPRAHLRWSSSSANNGCSFGRWTRPSPKCAALMMACGSHCARKHGHSFLQ